MKTSANSHGYFCTGKRETVAIWRERLLIPALSASEMRNDVHISTESRIICDFPLTDRLVWLSGELKEKRIKIAILGSRGIPASYGGFETVAQELSTGLAEKGFEVYVSCESRGLRMEPYDAYGTVRLVYFPVIRQLRNISEVILYDLFSVLWASFKVDIIYMLGYSSAPTLILPRLLRRIVVVNVDGLESSRRKFNVFLRFLYRSFEILNTMIADYIVVDSEIIGASYRRSYGVSPIFIPNCISKIAPLSPEVLKRYGLQVEEYYLVIARLIPDNNIDLIIEGFKRSNSHRKLAIVGPLDNNRYVKQLLLHKDGNVIFLGGIYEPRVQRALRHNCFAYIHGHEKGGINPSLVEALSCGNMVLALDVPFNREVAEESALYFKKDPDDLKEKLELLEGTFDRTPFMKNAYRVYKERYTVDKMVDLFAMFVMNIVRERGLVAR